MLEKLFHLKAKNTNVRNEVIGGITTFLAMAYILGVNPAILDPRDTYADASQWEAKAQDLAARFVKNFVKYTGNDAGKALVDAGPKF